MRSGESVTHAFSVFTVLPVISFLDFAMSRVEEWTSSWNPAPSETSQSPALSVTLTPAGAMTVRPFRPPGLRSTAETGAAGAGLAVAVAAAALAVLVDTEPALADAAGLAPSELLLLPLPRASKAK